MTLFEKIEAGRLDARKFVEQKVQKIADAVPSGTAINALSGGVDSSVVTMLGHRALGNKLITYFIDNGLMREGEPESVISLFREKGVPVILVSAQEEFFEALRGFTDPEEKREAVTQTFYKKVFARLVKESGAKFLLQGTIWTDIAETVAGIKRQHNVFEQIGIDPQEAFGYRIIEPLVQLLKDGVRKVARELGLPKSVYARMPFPGPALATRIIGEVTPERVATVRQATEIVEKALQDLDIFQCLAILHEDRVTGVRNGKREFGQQIEVRCWNSTDATVARPTNVTWPILFTLAQNIVNEVPGVVSVTYNITPKPPSTIEAI